MSADEDDTVTALAAAMRANVNDGQWTGWEQTARAVLASGVVTPTAPIRQLTEQWKTEAPPYDADLAWESRQIPWPVREQRRRYHMLAASDELRALIDPQDAP